MADEHAAHLNGELNIAIRRVEGFDPANGNGYAADGQGGGPHYAAIAKRDTPDLGLGTLIVAVVVVPVGLAALGVGWAQCVISRHMEARDRTRFETEQRMETRDRIRFEREMDEFNVAARTNRYRNLSFARETESSNSGADSLYTRAASVDVTEGERYVWEEVVLVQEGQEQVEEGPPTHA
ncbi:hypothetical protein VE01_03042 [Pseudogymnoascus verrucosus]|uniref:Uncharacterized protein n=1 Tax=Pseudogymnoascus verrucosus TaxID=342668 RepID=A0A1B8GRJ0_9PEZI|nr:uncharacterized protein VE01_03042 [Pseudogymnoascus verrucosus]OBT98445.1 hypothetical protein VE01_03042 [Pseudogymnoascus verrucosus]